MYQYPPYRFAVGASQSYVAADRMAGPPRSFHSYRQPTMPFQPMHQYTSLANSYQSFLQPNFSTSYPQMPLHSMSSNFYQQPQQYMPATSMQQYGSAFDGFQAYPPSVDASATVQNAAPTARRPPATSMVTCQQCRRIKEQAKTISKEELKSALNEIHGELQAIRDPRQNQANVVELARALIEVPKSTLTSVASHSTFDHFRPMLVHLLRQLQRASYLSEEHVYLFRVIVKAIGRLTSKATSVDQYPSWLVDSTLLQSFAGCLTKIGTSSKFLHEKKGKAASAFVSLFDIYINYQTIATDADVLDRLVDPTVQCLTSSFYLDSFNSIETSQKLTRQQKFFLYKCPAFMTSYHGARLETVMEGLLTAILPSCKTLFSRWMPSVAKWKPTTMRAINHLLKLLSNGPSTPKLLATHLSNIDHVLTIIDTPALNDKVTQNVHNPETALVSTAVNFLSTMIAEPAILAHTKQKKVTSTLLRFAEAPDEPLVYSTYNIIAQTATEKEITEMPHPDALLSSVTGSLKEISQEGKPEDETQVLQLLQIIKGLAQHDQMKEEILKQGTFAFLMNCTKKYTGELLVLVLETLWSLSFSQQGALELRKYPAFIQQIQDISKSTSDEAMKKASDGLVWKLVREPAMLEKVAKQQEEEDNAEETEVETTEIIIGPDGKEQVVKKIQRISVAPPEQTYQYDMMISYCHAEQDLIRKIHQFLLDQGFKIWIDLNNMFGPAMSAMAEAVENSEFVLLCMSDSYKQSTYCQAEAEYAFGCKRRLLPLIVRPGYKPDGWLGFMIGSRIYVDFGRFDFDTACDKLMHEIAQQRKRPMPAKEAKAAAKEATGKETVVSTVVVQEPLPPPPPPPKVVPVLPEQYRSRQASTRYHHANPNRWTESDVMDFLYLSKLNELMPMCEHMDGRALIQLYKMCTVQANDTYSLLNDELKDAHSLKLPIGIYTRFLSAMERVEAAHKPPVEPPRIKYVPRPMLPPAPIEIVTPAPTIPPYDIILNSNASTSEVMQLAQRVAPHVWSLRAKGHRHPLYL